MLNRDLEFILQMIRLKRTTEKEVKEWAVVLLANNRITMAEYGKFISELEAILAHPQPRQDESQ